MLNDELSYDDDDYSELIRLRDEEKSIGAVQIMAERNYKLVHYIVHKIGFHDPFYEYDDLVSIGSIGLMRACYRYDGNVRFSTYASKCIWNEIMSEFRKNKSRVECRCIRRESIHDSEGNELPIFETIPAKTEMINESWIPYIMKLFDVSVADQKLFVDYYYRGIDQVSLAETYGLSQARISRKLSRMTKIIKHYF